MDEVGSGMTDTAQVIRLITQSKRARAASKCLLSIKVEDLAQYDYPFTLPRRVLNKINDGFLIMRPKKYLDGYGKDLPGMGQGPHYLVSPAGQIVERWDFSNATWWTKGDLV